MDRYYLDIIQYTWLTFAFFLGAIVGSFLNVVIARMQLEKSFLWPSSRCGNCLQPIRFRDNIPILSWFLLRGRCRSCGVQFSSRYMWVELGTALGFTALWYFLVMKNSHNIPHLRNTEQDLFQHGIPWRGVVLFLHHATLLSFLIAAACCDFDRRVIPLPLAITGTVIGLTFSTMFPWPWPNEIPQDTGVIPDQPWFFEEHRGKIPSGVYQLPLWGPLPDWLTPGSHLLGLLTGLAGAAVGTLLIRLMKWVFETGMEREALGLGDADFMMMAGSFVGWQITLVGFFAGAIASLVLIAPLTLKKGKLPFAPGLAIGVFGLLMTWHVVGERLQGFLFEEVTLFVAAVIMGGGMFLAGLFLRKGKQ